MCHFLNQNKPFTSQDNFFAKAINDCSFHIYSDASFSDQKWFNSANIFSLGRKNINIILIDLLVSLIVENFENILRLDA